MGSSLGEWHSLIEWTWFLFSYLRRRSGYDRWVFIAMHYPAAFQCLLFDIVVFCSVSYLTSTSSVLNCAVSLWDRTPSCQMLPASEYLHTRIVFYLVFVGRLHNWGFNCYNWHSRFQAVTPSIVPHQWCYVCNGFPVFIIRYRLLLHVHFASYYSCCSWELTKYIDCSRSPSTIHGRKCVSQ